MSNFKPDGAWKPVKRFKELKTGAALRLKAHPKVNVTFKFEGHGYAIVHAPLLGRDAMCRLGELEVLV